MSSLKNSKNKALESSDIKQNDQDVHIPQFEERKVIDKRDSGEYEPIKMDKVDAGDNQRFSKLEIGTSKGLSMMAHSLDIRQLSKM